MAWWKAWIEQEGVSVKGSPHFNPNPDAETLYKAMKGIGTNEQAIIDVLTKRSNAQRQEIAKSFKAQFGKVKGGPYYGSSLEEDIQADTSGYLERILVCLLQDLYAAGEKICGTDEMKFITILCTRSATHLMRVFEEYEKIANKSIEDSIKSETHGSLEEAMLTVGRHHGDYKNALLNLVGNDL
ncbi:Annexin A8 [Camelus dromedarius]|uniref:Annexin n=1 Tax=Camelus dromedarius TaxID=9838 RepID=A0A5N4DI18_CAMDR|nr:Annexin A8 [Camelus dromedarius]